MLHIQNTPIDPMIVAGFVAAITVFVFALAEDQLRSIPRIVGRSGDAWPTHRAKARRQAKHKAALHRRAIARRRALARGHLVDPALSLPMTRRAHGTSSVSCAAGRGGGGGTGVAASTRTLTYHGLPVELLEWEPSLPGMCWVTMPGFREAPFLVGAEQVLCEVATA